MERKIKLSPLKNLILFQGKLFYFETEEPYEGEYLFLKNYIGRDYLIFGERFFECVDSEFQEYETILFFEDTINQKRYFGVKKKGSTPWGDGVCVFYLDKDNHAHIYARKFAKIKEDLFKIGNILYQITQTEMKQIGKCVSFDVIGERVEAYAGEFERSAMSAYEKVGSNWHLVAEWKP